MSREKGLSWDLIRDIIFSIQNACWKEGMRKVWEIPVSRLPDKLLEVRLVPLNKVYPKVPKAKDFRPVCGMSPLVKFLEARFHDKFKKYAQNYLIKSQADFIAGRSTMGRKKGFCCSLH
jgi:hypothetical protein